MDPRSDLVQILINRLLNAQRRALYSIQVIFNILQRYHPLLDLPARPHRLDAISSSLLYDLVDRKLWPALPPLVSLESVLDGSNGRNALQQSLEEKDHLLVFLDVDLPVKVEHVEANGDDDVEVGGLED